MYLFFTGTESRISGIPFLLDNDLCPLSVPNHWLRKLASNGSTSSYNTWRTYAYALFDFFNYLEFVNVHWTEINDDILYEYRNIQDINPSKHTKKYLKRKTINSRLIAIGKFYKFAHENKYIEKNNVVYKTLRYRIPRNLDMYAHLDRTFERTVPAVAFERLSKSEPKWRTQENVVKWINSIQDWRNKLIAKLMFQTGMRRAEVTMLKVSQLPDVKNIDLNFHEVKFLIIGKGHKTRYVFISTRLFLEIKDYINIERKALLRKNRKTHDSLFVTLTGEPLKPNTINQIFRMVSVKAGIKITPHMLRHSFAVYFLNHLKKLGHSQPLKALQTRLGHSNISSTLIYTHISDDDVAEESMANAMLFEMLMGNNFDEET
jgi:integrase/recombinase XerD